MTDSARWLLLETFACAATSVAIYLNTLDCGFCFDDRSAIEENQDLRPSSPWTNLIWDDFWGTPMNIEGSHKSYRPLCVLTFRLNYLVHELQPLGYHLVNVLLHCAVSFVFTLICAKVVFKGAAIPVLIAGLYFALHPVHVEAVAGVVGRAECLSALFYLLAFMAYRRSLEQNGRGVKWFFLSLLLCTCSVLSKEQGITVIAICLCYEFFIVRKNTLRSSIKLAKDIVQCRPHPPWLFPLLVHTVGMALFLGVVMFVRVRIMKAELPVFTIHDNPAVSLPTPFRQLHWLYLCFINAWVLLNPSFLCADWTMGTIPLIESLADPRNLLTLAVFIVLVTLGFHALSKTTRDHQAVFLALLFIIFPYLPASNLLFPVGFVVAERILYVPSMGFAILVGLGVDKLLRNKSPLVQLITKSCIIFLLAIHGIKTLERNRDWYSDLTLFTSAIRVNPHNGKIHNNVGHEYEHAGNLSYAEHMFRLAAEKQPDDIGAYINLGRVLKGQERYSEAEKAYQQAVELVPKAKTFRIAPMHINVFYNLANLVKLDPERSNEALQLYNRALSMKPDMVEAYINKGDLLLKLDRAEEARQSFLKAISYNPNYADAHFNLGTVYLRLEDPANAEAHYKKALAIDPQHHLSLFNLGMLYVNMKDKDRKWENMSRAKEMFKQLLKSQPTNDKVMFQLAMAHIELAEMEEAKDAFRRTLQITPTYRSALYNLALLLYQDEDYQSALGYLVTLHNHHPSHDKGMLLLGDTYMHMKQLENARKAYELSIQNNPDSAIALHNLGVVMVEMGQYKEAKQLFSRTLALNPNHKSARKHLQSLEQQKKQHQQH